MPRLKKKPLPTGRQADLPDGEERGRKGREKKNGTNIKRKISKKIVLRLALFVAVIGMASLFDIYFENDRVEIEETETGSAEGEKEKDSLLLISQSTNFGAKTSENKTLVRKLQEKSHDKFIQKYYQIRNYQVLKAEVQTQTTPLINSYHYLVFKNYFYSIPDYVPLNS